MGAPFVFLRRENPGIRFTLLLSYRLIGHIEV